MNSFSFRNRIAFYYIITTALLISVVFFVVYFSVKKNVYQHIENDISVELKELYKEIKINKTGFELVDASEWQEAEHSTINVNPIFIQFVDSKGNLLDKSPNLKNSKLKFNDNEIKDFEFFNSKIENIEVRQSQSTVFYDGKPVGYFIVAMSLEDTNLVLHKVQNVMIFAYLIVLALLFLIARFIVGRSIKPISNIISTANRITKDSLNDRIPLPVNKDELYTLSVTINSLLDRIENVIEREKQFTSDASHELRTPLAVISGTLEVLIRKPRQKEEYEEKVKYCINEVNRVNKLVDELLLLARFENQKHEIKNEKVSLNELMLDTTILYSQKINSKKISIINKINDDFYIQSDPKLISIIINNLVSNALKYSHDNGEVVFSISKKKHQIKLSIIDNGIGISEKDKQKIYNPFFRSDSLNHPEIKGTGLGLSIVKRLCDLLNIQIEIESQSNKGTIVNLFFNLV